MTKFWPRNSGRDGDAFGQRIQYAAANTASAQGGGGGHIGRSADLNDGEDQQETIEIVGIVPATRHALFEKEPAGGIYSPFARGFQSDISFYCSVPFACSGKRGRHGGFAPSYCARRRSFNSDLVGSEHSRNTLIQTWTSGWFAPERLCSLSLAALRLVWRYWVSTDGIALGFVLAAATGKILSGILYQVGALDPIAFTAAPLLLAIAAFVATWLPARRAAALNPVEALRYE